MGAVFGAKVDPMMLPFYEEIELADGKRVAVISFPRGTSKPGLIITSASFWLSPFRRSRR